MAPSSPSAGPVCTSMSNVANCLSQMPGADNGASLSSSTAILNLINSRRHLHIYTLRISIDEILHIGTLIQDYYLPRDRRPGRGAVIIVDDADDGFAKITALAAHITGERASADPSSNASVSSFSRIVILRGHKPPNLCANEADYTARLRAVGNTFRSTMIRLSQKFALHRIIWHAHQDPTLILHILQTTTAPPIDAITIFSALRLDSTITLPHPTPGHPLPNPWPLLLTATSRLPTPLIFASPPALHPTLHHYTTALLTGLPHHLPSLLPRPAWTPSLGALLDHLLASAFRLLAGGDCGPRSPRRPAPAVVTELRRRLPAAVARPWARVCVDPRSYGERAVRDAVRAALPGGVGGGLPAMAAAVANPAPPAPVAALERLAVGPGGVEGGALWAVRVQVAPRGGVGVPRGAVEVRVVPRGGNVFLLAGRDAGALQTRVGARWAAYVAEVARREEAFPRDGRADGEFGVAVDVARAWVTVVPGVVAEAMEEWERAVRGGLGGAERRMVEREVRALVREAREGAFTRVCEAVLRG
ncbi:hypothetical protein GTA08_BOTSDO08209 [Neofusicoccum parvum]|uniref:Uncharacterized protein n=1 Tax=Neofusicoccum parvum TaxID=310453 RepID=A0ACB5S9T4_9PEZI|nr:hypothetical protein GTA08_BOTSDO08209 [Neofusicoccum parvum]